MEISYNWEFNPLECYPTSAGETDVVFRVHWQLHANADLYNAYTIGIQDIPLSSNSIFIPFSSLTKDIVQGWVENQMGLERINGMKEELRQKIESQIAPSVLKLSPPWAQENSAIE